MNQIVDSRPKTLDERHTSVRSGVARLLATKLSELCLQSFRRHAFSRASVTSLGQLLAELHAAALHVLLSYHCGIRLGSTVDDTNREFLPGVSLSTLDHHLAIELTFNN